MTVAAFKRPVVAVLVLALLANPGIAQPLASPAATNKVEPVVTGALNQTNRVQSAEKGLSQLADLEKKAQRGDAEAQFQVGLENFQTNGTSNASDDAVAVKWFRKAAEQGIAGAEYRTATVHPRREPPEWKARKAHQPATAMG